MEDNKEGNENVENQEPVNEAAEGNQEGVKEERPEANWKAELDRKNRELERYRQMLAQREQEPARRDPNDMRTWTDIELKAVMSNPSAEALPYKDQAQEILLDRKLEAKLARREEVSKRVSADLELKTKFPESLDPASSLSMKIDELTTKYDLSKTPAGRLVAAKLAAAELNQGKDASAARGRKNEQDRVTRVKGQMVDGDRPKPTDADNPESKEKALKEKFLSEKSTSHEAVKDFLDQSGLRERFKKAWGA